MLYRLGCFFLFLLLLSTPTLSLEVEVALSDLAAANRSTLFERVFGKSAQSAPQYLEIQFSFDLQPPILMGIQYSFVTHELLLPIEQLRPFLDQYIKPEFVHDILSGQDGAGYISRTFLESRGFTFQFDSQKLFLNIDSPYSFRNLVVMDLFGNNPYDRGVFNSAPVSGYVNFDGAIPLMGDAGGSSTLGWSGNLNNKGWTIRSGGQFSSNATNTSLPFFSWNAFSVMHDFESDFSRLTFGTTVPFLGSHSALSASLFGVGYRRVYSDLAFTYPFYRYQKRFVFNKKTSLVIVRNGIKIFYKTLPAGEYFFSNIPGDYGYNDISFLEADEPFDDEIKLAQPESNISFLKDFSIRSRKQKFLSQSLLKFIPTTPVLAYNSAGFGHVFYPKMGLFWTQEVFSEMFYTYSLDEVRLNCDAKDKFLRVGIAKQPRSGFYIPEFFRTLRYWQLSSPISFISGFSSDVLPWFTFDSIEMDNNWMVHGETGWKQPLFSPPRYMVPILNASSTPNKSTEMEPKYALLLKDSFLYDTRVLGPDRVEFGTYAGYPISGSGSALISDLGFSVSAFTRFGLQTYRDLSLSLQFRPGVWIGGATLQQMSSFALHELKVDYSQTTDNAGYQTTYTMSGYPFLYPNTKIRQTLSAQFQYTTSQYSNGSLLGQGVNFLFAPVLSLDFASKVSFSLAANYYNIPAFGSFVGYTVGSNFSLVPGLTAFFSVSQGQGFTPSSEPYMQFGVSFLEPFGGSSVFTSLDSLPSSHLSYSWTDNQQNGYSAFFDGTYQNSSTFQTSLNLRRDRTAYSWSQYQRTDFSSHSFGYSTSTQRGHINTNLTTTSASNPQASLQFGTALAFVDGHLGISDTIGDSFIMLYPSKSLENKKISFGPYYEFDGFGPVVLNSISSYSDNYVFVDPNSAPLGVDLGKTQYIIRPRYGSGTAIEIGRGSGNLLVTGQFKDSNGALTPFVYAKLFDLANPLLEPKTIVSNKKGIFNLSGIAEGMYEIRFINVDSEPIVVPIKAKKGVVVKLGEITLIHSKIEGGKL